MSRPLCHLLWASLCPLRRWRLDVGLQLSTPTARGGCRWLMPQLALRLCQLVLVEALVGTGVTLQDPWLRAARAEAAG